MGNVWRVFIRDVGRLIKTPAAMVVVIALLILPSLYTWYNVIGFWNPYENTGALKVVVVNEDAGGSNELTGSLNVGDRIVEELEQNHQLDWQFKSYDEAMDDLDAGSCYAVFVLPEDFTAKLLTITSGTFEEPQIQYYVNEKLGPVSPKITDTGASTLDQTVNATFVSTVSDVAVETVNDAIVGSETSINDATSAGTSRVSQARAELSQTIDALSTLSSQSQESRASVAEIGNGLQSAAGSLGALGETLDDALALSQSLNESLQGFSATIVPGLQQSLSAVSSISADAKTLAYQVGDAIDRVEPDIVLAQSRIDDALTQSAALGEELHRLLDSLPADATGREELEEALAQLDSLQQHLEEASATVKTLTSSFGSTKETLTGLADTVDGKTQEALGAAQNGLAVLSGTGVGSLQSSVSQLTGTLSTLKTSTSAAQELLGQVASSLNNVDDALILASQAFQETGGLLQSVDQELETLETDISALGQARLYESFLGVDGLDASRISSFMKAPTNIETEKLYPIKVYGAAMAPLFMNLTFWIGAFMLMVIMKLEVDDRGIKNLTLNQRYLGRFLLFAIMVVLQALICCAGLVVIGIDPVNVGALMLAASAASLAYLSIIYAFSLTLQHIGKGICIILVFAQIPGASGLYPIEMTAPFFQAIYPYLPFTYGIGAMREAICGFYESAYVQDLVVLALFFVLFLLVGLFLRPRLANVNEMVGNQIAKGALFNGEHVEAPTRPYRFSQIVKALSDNQAYHRALVKRYEHWKGLYPRIVRILVAIAIAVPLIFTVVVTLSPTEKIWVLTAWLLWLVIVFIALVVVENLGYAFERQLALSSMDAHDINELLVASATRKSDMIQEVLESEPVVSETTTRHEQPPAPPKAKEGSDE